MNTIEGRFTGLTAVVTGAGSGIGRATALRLAREGARVVASDISEERLKEFVAEFPDLDIVSAVSDVSVQEGTDAIMAAAGGTVDVLVNNAGIMDGFLPAAEVDDKTWERVFAVNVTGPMRLIRAVLPGMIDKNHGTIVNVSSEAALRGSAAGVAYTASKHAVNGLTLSTAVMYRGQGIRCNAVAPGPVNTGIGGDFRSQHAAMITGPLMQAMIGSLAEPEDLAAIITWLASEEARNVNGMIIASDGGWSAL